MNMPTHPDSTTAEAKTATTVRLTQTVKAGGCASKLAPGLLIQVLAGLPQQQDDNLLVGFSTADDAGVYRINDTLALVQTVDFFTPMVDDPNTFGRVAAANALSDVYAMGGQPLTALSIVCFPQQEDPKVLQEIMRGGLSVMEEAGCIVVGGHSVRDTEIKFGYAVTGLIDPKRVKKNCTAIPGDSLVFSKAIGTGVITTALKQGRAKDSWVDAAVESMTKLNRAAAEIASSPSFDARAMTDVTGFGLMGHAREMAVGSGVQLVIDTRCVPILTGAVAAAEAGCIPAGLIANREFAECIVVDDAGAHVDPVVRTLLFDPQTSGGLLISIAAAHAPALTQQLQQAGYPAAVIGHVREGDPKIVLR
jgi:selenide,water dikinase